MDWRGAFKVGLGDTLSMFHEEINRRDAATGRGAVDGVFTDACDDICESPVLKHYLHIVDKTFGAGDKESGMALLIDVVHIYVALDKAVHHLIITVRIRVRVWIRVSAGID